MKKLLFLLLLITSLAHGQEDTTRYLKYLNSYGVEYSKVWGRDILRTPFKDTSAINAQPGALQAGLDGNPYWWAGAFWIPLRVNTTSFVQYPDSLLTFTTHTQLADSLAGFVRLDTQNPIATLSASPLIYEFTSAGTQNINLVWTAGRSVATLSAKATNPLSTVVVGGITQSFSQPAPGSTVGGTQAVTVPTNTNTTLSILVTTTDGKTATQSITAKSQNKLYVGYVSSASPSDADILAATGGNVGGAFATNRLDGPTTLASPGSTLYTVIAYPASMGTATIKIGGFVTAFNLTVRSFVNAGGASVSYNIYVSPFPSAGAVNYQIL